MLKTVIYTLREKENLSQEKLAEILGVSRQAVQKWETGVSVPELSKIIEISKYFGISLDTMLLGRTRRIVVDELKYKDIKPLYKNIHDWEFYASGIMDEYKQSTDEGLDIEQYKNLFEAVDAIDGNCDIYLKSGRLKMIIGSHVLVLGAKDKVNNESTLSIVVTIVNDIPPIFILSDKIIQTSPARPLTVEQIKQVLENHILKNNFVKNIEFDASEYLNNTDVEGEYIVSYSYLNQNNEKVEDTFEIIVKGDSQAKNTRVSIWTKIRIFFEKLWNWICGRGFKANSEL